MSVNSIKIITPILFVILFTVCLLYANQFSKGINFAVSENPYVNQQFKYQIILLLITGASLFVTWMLNKQNFSGYFSLGKINAIGQELKVFGIKKGDTWLKSGLSLCFVVSMATGIFLYFQLKQLNPDWSLLRSGILWVIFFSLTNSFGEEMIYRLGIITPLKGLLSPYTIYFISAILFGIPHFYGMPNGLIGVSMAALLGFVLAKSVNETNGFFWAWLIHFLQDVLIIGTLLVTSNKA